MTSLAPDYDKLPPLHKLEVFESALAQTDGQVKRRKYVPDDKQKTKQPARGIVRRTEVCM